MAEHTSGCIPLWLFPYSPRPAVVIFDPIRRFGWCSFPVESIIGGLNESVLKVVNTILLLRSLKWRCESESADMSRDKC